MEVFSSAADIAPLLKSIQLGDSSGTTRLLTESVFTDPELLLELESLPNEELMDGTIAQPITPSEMGQPASIAKDSVNSQWKIFGSTFVTIFLAELGDKTQVATLLMSADSHAPWVVFTGAATALVSTSLIGVLIGHWLSSRVSPQTLDRAAGVMLAFISLWLFWDVVRM